MARRRSGWNVFAAVLLFCLAAPLALRAGDFCTKKGYRNWSADETQRILEESPWATTRKLAGLQSAITSGDSPNDTRYRGEMESNPSISYTLQFPLRAANSTSRGARFPTELALPCDEPGPEGDLRRQRQQSFSRLSSLIVCWCR